MPTIGKLAPKFTLPNQDGEMISLNDFRGKRVIMFSFPKAGTAGCNAQACGFRDEFPDIEAQEDLVVLGISTDSQATLRSWKAKQKLHYDLLSDTDHKVLTVYDAWGQSAFGLIKLPVTKRGFWGIDEEGILRVIDFDMMPNASVKAALKFAQAPV